MKKNIILLGALMISSFAYSQIGINSEAPKATLDVTAKTTGNATAEGIIAPRLTGDQIKDKDIRYDLPQKGAIIYATSAVTGTPAGKTANITAEGYYYFDGALWVKFGSGTVTPGTEPWYVQNSTTQATVNNQNIYQQGKVAVGFTDADGVTTKQLEVKGHFKSQADVTGRDVGIDTDLAGFGTYMYNVDDASDFFNTTGNTIGVTQFGTSLYSKSATNSGTVSAAPGSVKLEAGGQGLTNNVARIDMGTSDLISNVPHIEISSSKGGLSASHDDRTSINVRNGQGIEFRYYAPGASIDDIGKYTFPRAAGTVGQVLGVATATAYGSTGGVDNQLAWQNISDLAPEPWRIQGTTNPATANNQNIYQEGSVSIGSQTPIAPFTSNGSTITPKLSVTGNVASTGSFYTTTGKYADYVFEDYFDGVSKIDETYKFKSLAETAAYIKENKHLPGVTPIKDILKTENGYTVNLSELSIQQLEKIEELYLHTIEQQQEISKQKTEISHLKSRLEKLEQLLLKEDINK